jgi:hypothetical protein
MASLVGEGVLLVVLLGISTFAWNQRHTTVNTKTVVETKTVQAPASPTPPPLALGPSETLTVPVDSVAPGYKLTINVPTAWRTVDIKSLVSLSAYNDFNLNDLAAILRAVPEHAERGKVFGTAEPVDTLDLLATSRWAATSDDAPATAANKQAFLAYVASVKTADDISAKKCTAINFGQGVCTDAKVKPQVVASADGLLSGFAYLTMTTQSMTYDPSVVVQMVGTLAGKPLWLRGSFSIYDQQYVTLGSNGVQANLHAPDYVAKVTAARQAFASNPPADTLEMYGRLVAAVGSMRFGR